MRFLRRTPVRTFVLYPLITAAWEFALHRGSVTVDPAYLPLMLWGYLQYRLCGRYRARHGGGGPGLENPPQRLVTTGPYACSRNPMYLGHLIYLCGVALVLRSWFGVLIMLGAAVWFHARILQDEKRLAKQLGEPYLEYLRSVKRWIPGLF
ncbi:MAG TPA: isoprenylcysteine carboxylmethyltransferase family protein [candidate division Zixibacteria bacterium]|nr:isoprenylcysteine carboxylmethyltransferase family protein [candidate division Zixibacteria bacterium]